MYCLSWNSYKNNLCNGFAELQQREEFVDMTLVAEGHQVKVHKNLVSLASPYIKNAIKSVPCTHPIIFLTNITLKVLGQLVEYIYTGQVHVETVDLNTFVKAATELQLPGIANDLTDPTTLNIQKEKRAPSLVPRTYKKNHTLNDRKLEPRSGDALKKSTNDIVILEDIKMAPVDDTNSCANNMLIKEKLKNVSKRKPRKTNQLVDTKKLKLYNGEAENANGCGNIALVTETPPADNDNNPVARILITNKQQSTNTSETLSTSNYPTTSHNIQILENRLLDCGTRKNTQETNNVPETNASPQNQTLTVIGDAADNLDDFLKFPDPPNSLVEEISSTSQSQQLQLINPNKETKLGLSLDLRTRILPQQYTISSRGSLQLILNRYIYSMYSADGDVKRRWRCVDYRSKQCPAYVDTEDDLITHRKHYHNHPHHDYKILKKIKANLVFGSLCKALIEQRKFLNETQDSVKSTDTDSE